MTPAQIATAQKSAREGTPSNAYTPAIVVQSSPANAALALLQICRTAIASKVTVGARQAAATVDILERLRYPSAANI